MMPTANAQPVTKLPKAVRVSRLEFDIVTFATLSVTASMLRMKEILCGLYDRSGQSGAPDPSDIELSTLFNDAWTIVDKAHLLRKILEPKMSGADAGSPAGRFLALSGPASVARDKMDHIHEQIDNMAGKTRKVSAPILGVITATMFDESKVVDGKIEYLDGFILSHSEFHHKQNIQVLPDKLFPVTAPVDHIRLHAFASVVDLSSLASTIVGVTDVLQTRQKEPPDSDRRLGLIVRATFETPAEVSRV